MITLRNTFAAVLVLGLVACSPPASEAPAAPVESAAPPSSGPAPAVTGKAAVALDPGGLMIVIADTGSTRMLDFGLPQAQVIEIVTNVAGAPEPVTTNSECGGGPMQFAEFPGGLTLLFQDDKLAGWSVGPGSAGKPSTMSGVGVGSTRSDLAAAYSGVTVSETSLGQEFSAGGLYGVLDGSDATAKIEVMWAGTSCVFR